MEDQEIKAPSILKASMNYGALLGLSLIIVSLIYFLLGKGEFELHGGINFVVVVSAIVFGIRNFRDKKLGGHITYGESLKMGTLITFFGSVVFGFAYYTYIKFVDSSIALQMLEQTEKWMVDNKYTQAEIDLGMPTVRKYVVFIIFMSHVVFNTIFGFILSLFISIFMMRKENIFNN